VQKTSIPWTFGSSLAFGLAGKCGSRVQFHFWSGVRPHPVGSAVVHQYGLCRAYKAGLRRGRSARGGERPGPIPDLYLVTRQAGGRGRAHLLRPLL